MFYKGKKYYHVFTAGDYTQKKVTPEMLQEIARSYDTQFHEAPVWLGHPKDEADNEPEALAWIDSVIAQGDKLYVSFSYVSDEMKQLVDTQAFKRVSVEIVQYKTNDGKEFLYLYAVGLTNRPAVKGLEPISFAISGKSFNSSFSDRLAFNENFSNYNSNQMNEYLKKVATGLGIDCTKFTTDSSLQEAITLKFNEMKTSIDPNNPAAKQASASLTAVQDELNAIKEERIAELVDGAIAAFKVKPADKQKWIDLGKTNYSVLKDTIATMTVHKEFADKIIKTGDGGSNIPDLENPKFTGKDGKKITYGEFLKMDPNAQAKFSAEEVAELKKSNL